MPTLKISTFSSYPFAKNISGAIYLFQNYRIHNNNPGVPHLLANHFFFDFYNTSESPKSPILIEQTFKSLLLSKIFSNFKSLWTTSFDFKYFIASRIYKNMRCVSSSVSYL